MPGRQSYKTRWQIALANSGMGHGPVCIGLALSLYAKAAGGGVFPSAQRVASGIGVQRKMVTGHRRTLEDAGWLREVHGYKRRASGKVYQLTIPAEARRATGWGGVRVGGATDPIDDGLPF